MDTQTQIDRLIELAIVQRAELKKLVSELPQLREHLNAEIERVFESTEPQLRTELEDWTTKQAHDQTVKLGGELEAKIVALSKSLEATTQTRYNAIMAERAQNIDLAKKAEDKLAEVAQAIPVQVKQIVTDELARFPRAGEIDQLRKEFAEPRGLNPRGRWEPGATYYKLDLVAYNGDSYVANEETSEKPNRTSSKWTLNAARGQAGGGGFMSPAIGDYTASMITNVPAGVITSTNVQDAINELAADVDVSQNTLDALVTNADSVTITKGQVVYAFGSVGNRMSVKLALNTGDATSSKTIGVVLDSSIAAGATGNIRCVGVVDGLTLGSYTEGDVLYLGATAGSVTATKPYAPNHLVYVGIVERANNGNGELYVKIQNGYELDEIHDVQITSAPLAGALLMRDATNSLWKANRLTGTTNQVTVTNADTAVTLSLPTSLASVDSITASASTALTLTGGSTGASLVLGQGASGPVTVSPKGSASMQVTNGSSIGSVLLGGGSGSAELYGDGSSMILSAFGARAIQFYQNSLEKARFAATTGNLLIGTTTDINRLTVAQDAGGSDVTAGNGQVMIAGSTNTNKRLAIGYNTTSDYGWMQAALLGTAYKPIAINPNGGNLLIGTTTDMTGSGGLKIAGTTAATSTTSGALIVAGGVGVSGAIYNGSNIVSTGSFITSATGAALQLTGANPSIEIGAAGSANSPLIDFHSSASSTDYDARIVASGGTASAGAGTLSLTAATINVPGTTSASSSTVGALTIGNGTAATNVAIGGGTVNAARFTSGGTGSTDRIIEATANSTVFGSATALYGVVATPTFPATATLAATGVYSSVGTAASAFTLTDGIALRAAFPAIGAGSSITTMTGLLVNNQGATGVTNAYGIDIAAQSGAATTNIGLRNAGITSLTNSEASVGSTSGALRVTGGIYAGAASVFGGQVSITKNDLILSLTSATGTSANYASFNNTGGSHYIGTDSSAGGSFFSGLSTAYSMNISAQSGRDLFIGSGAKFIKMAHTSGDLTFPNGAATFAGAVTASGAVTAGIARATSWSLDNSLAYFGHSSAAGAAGTYAMLQSAAGNTQLNGTSTLTLGINNSPHLSLASGAATFAVVVIKKNYTVATLPAAASYTYGEAYVSDATQAAGTSLGSAPTGGGSVKRGVYSDGSSWLLR